MNIKDLLNLLKEGKRKEFFNEVLRLLPLFIFSLLINLYFLLLVSFSGIGVGVSLSYLDIYEFFITCLFIMSILSSIFILFILKNRLLHKFIFQLISGIFFFVFFMLINYILDLL